MKNNTQDTMEVTKTSGFKRFLLRSVRAIRAEHHLNAACEHDIKLDDAKLIHDWFNVDYHAHQSEQHMKKYRELKELNKL